MNAIAMLERCGVGQKNQDVDSTLPATYLSPPALWRAQETLTDPDVRPFNPEDY